MGIRKPNFKKDLKKLMSAQNEEEVLDCLLRIIKVYNVYAYKDSILTNPYFKMLIPELKEKVLKELNKLRKSISSEIKNIDGDLEIIETESDPDLTQQVERLKQLRHDCMLLINEVDEKKLDLENLL
jgi:hypothetical protein